MKCEVRSAKCEVRARKSGSRGLSAVGCRPLRVLLAFGTRPEAIKLAPVVKQLERWPKLFKAIVAVTAQHREMLDQVLSVFDIRPDFDLDIMRPGQTLKDVTVRGLMGMEDLLQRLKPDIALVQGDTTTAFASALAAFHQRIPVGHVEAGLRTFDRFAPFPEEMNRRLISALADVHFAPTQRARENLLREGVPKSNIHVTGNTVIDALLLARDMQSDGDMTDFRLGKSDRVPSPGRKRVQQPRIQNPESRILLVTAHRRESFGPGFKRICSALARIVRRNPDVEVVYPVHPNPNVKKAVKPLRGLDRVHLITPLEYLPFVHLMERAWLILSDSGGIQEEAPALGKPVLVLRDKTERPEAIEAGTASLVGTEPGRIVAETERLLRSTRAYNRMARAHNPFGDGKAAQRIVRILKTTDFTAKAQRGSVARRSNGRARVS